MDTSEKCPMGASTESWLWAHNKPVLDELRVVVEPLVKELDAYVEADVAQGDAVARETQAVRTQYGIPFGVPYTLLPPRLFSELYDGAEAPQLPQSETEAHQLVASYRQRSKKPPLEDMPPGSYAVPHEDRIGEILNDLQWMMYRGVGIDPVKWEQYRQAGRELARHGRYDLDVMSLTRARSIKSLYHYPALAQLVHSHATGTFEHYMTMPTAALDVGGRNYGLQPVGYLFMPEGAYGRRFAEKQLRTSVYMVNSAQQTLGGMASRIAAAHPEMIVRHTTRGRDGRSLDASLIGMAQEGDRSRMEVVALLTADVVPGYEDPDQLYEAIVTQGIIEQFTRAIPQGMLGPLTFAGKYFPKLLITKGNGKLTLNPMIMHEIKQAKRAMAQQDMAEWVLYWSASEEDRRTTFPPVSTSLICPAALPHGALTRMNNASLRAFKAFRW